MTDQPPADGDTAAPEIVQAFVRGLAVIRAFDAHNAALTLSEVARRAELTRAAAGRFLRTLEMLGYVREDDRRFALTPRVLELGFSYLSASAVPEVIRPHLQMLSESLDESASAAVLDGADIVYVARVPVRRIMSIGIAVGTRFPAFATSMGRVLLAAADDDTRAAALAEPLPRLTPVTVTDAGSLRAELDRVARQGWAVVDGELEIGLQSVAVPVRGRDETVVASINVSMSSGRYSTAVIENEIVPAALRTAEGISADLRLL